MVSFALDAWVRPLRPRFESKKVLLLCPTAFHRDRVRERFLALIERHLEAEHGAPLEVELAIAPPQSLGRQRAAMRSVAPRPERPEPQRAPARVASATTSRTPSRREPTAQQALPYRFENFVVGPCNALAREACFAVANESQRGLNPLFLSAAAGRAVYRHRAGDDYDNGASTRS